LAKKSSNTKITRRSAGIRPSANTKKPHKTQRKIKMIIIFYLRESAVADIRFASGVEYLFRGFAALGITIKK